MKVYRLGDDGVMYTSDWPDGSMLLEINSRHSDDATGWDSSPIEMIDWNRQVYARAAPSGVVGPYGPEHPFPPKWHCIDAHEWRPLKEGE